MTEKELINIDWISNYIENVGYKELTKEELIEMIDKVFESDDTLSNIQNKVVDIVWKYLPWEFHGLKKLLKMIIQRSWKIPQK